MYDVHILYVSHVGMERMEGVSRVPMICNTCTSIVYILSKSPRAVFWCDNPNATCLIREKGQADADVKYPFVYCADIIGEKNVWENLTARKGEKRE